MKACTLICFLLSLSIATASFASSRASFNEKKMPQVSYENDPKKSISLFNKELLEGATDIANQLGGLTAKLKTTYNQDGSIRVIEFATRDSWRCRTNNHSSIRLACINSRTLEQKSALMIAPDGWNW